MKNINSILAIVLIAAIAIGSSSCVILSRHDNGHHKGWYKNSNKSNPPAKPGRGNRK